MLAASSSENCLGYINLDTNVMIDCEWGKHHIAIDRWFVIDDSERLSLNFYCAKIMNQIYRSQFSRHFRPHNCWLTATYIYLHSTSCMTCFPAFYSTLSTIDLLIIQSCADHRVCDRSSSIDSSTISQMLPLISSSLMMMFTAWLLIYLRTFVHYYYNYKT